MEQEAGFEIDLAETGEEALEKIETFRPDILLLDHKLPSMSGLDVLNELSGKGYDLITVMITAYASLETAITATKRGAFDFLAKPFTPDELTAAIYKSAKHLMLERRARQLAQEKRQLRFQLISMVSHELKAPLAAILGYLAVLRDRSVAAKPVYDEIIERSDPAPWHAETDQGPAGSDEHRIRPEKAGTALPGRSGDCTECGGDCSPRGEGRNIVLELTRTPVRKRVRIEKRWRLFLITS